MVLINDQSNTHPVTEEEMSLLKEKIYHKYKAAAEDCYYNGSSLTQVCKKYNIHRRGFQRELKKFNFCYMGLRYGHIARELSKGFSIKSIRSKLGLSIREDLNKTMQEKLRGEISPSKRWRVLKRDNFKCVLCGADCNDRKLHIDHIIPISEGGTNDLKNLRVLCSSCNLGRNTDLK